MARAGLLAAVLAASASAAPWLSVPPALYQLIAVQANATLAQVGGGNAYPTQGALGKDGVWRWQTSAGYGNWVGAFQGGLLWKLANYSAGVGDAAAAAWWQQAGNDRGAYMAANQFNNGTHDVGFMLLPLFLQQYQQTGNTTARDILINGAHSLAERFSTVVGCFRSWGAINSHPQFEVIIDNMLNTELPLWVAQETGDAKLLEMVLSHAWRMQNDVYQPFNPGCVWHLVTYDDRSGAILNRSSTPQGLGLNTVWSRGQAWATYGFAMAHRYTQNASHLETAAASADCFIRLTGLCCAADSIPLWDFNATGKAATRDSSAAMVAASGMIELAWASSPADRARYLAFVQTVLASAMTPAYQFTPAEGDAVLKNGTTSYPVTGVPIIYGDYYLLEAAMRWDATPQAWRQEALDYLAARGGRFFADPA